MSKGTSGQCGNTSKKGKKLQCMEVEVEIGYKMKVQDKIKIKIRDKVT